MNRPIKFRAWVATDYDDDDRPIEFEMVEWEPYFFYDSSRVTMFCGEFPSEDSDDVFLMQFTGLHDMNGKEIYEGDIIECKVLKHWRDVVIFEAPTFKGEGGGFQPGLVRVIGNIYENPEELYLLREKKYSVS